MREKLTNLLSKTEKELRDGSEFERDLAFDESMKGSLIKATYLTLASVLERHLADKIKRKLAQKDTEKT